MFVCDVIFAAVCVCFAFLLVTWIILEMLLTNVLNNVFGAGH